MTLKLKKLKANDILKELEGLYPDAQTELHHKNVFELLVATVLSAQSTDKGVNSVTPELFKNYPDAAALSQADLERVEQLISKIGFFRVKSKNIVRLSQILLERHGGEVPNDFAALLELPGVGRKTANVVLANAFGRPAIAVDTHVGRLARRMGFSSQQDPDKVEQDLEAVFAKSSWVFLHNALIFHGRRVCKAQKPLCESCILERLCPRIGL
jgi:endonuclease III